MSYYKICPYCGAHLDPGEICDCKAKAVVSAANADGGKVELVLTDDVSTSNITKV